MADHPAACVHWFRFLKLRHTVSYLTGYPLGIRGSHTATPWGVADPGWAWALCGGGMITGVPGEASSLAGASMDGPDPGRHRQGGGRQAARDRGRGVYRFAVSYLKALDIIEARRAEAGR